MEVDPQRVIEILARRIAAEAVSSAMREAVIEQMKEERDGGGTS